MRYYIVSILFFIISPCVLGQSGYFQSPVELALSGSIACYPDNLQASIYPAQLAAISANSLGISYNNRYMLPELSSSAISSQWRTELGAFGAMGNYFGSYLYSQSELALAYAKELGEKSLGGIALIYQETKVEANREHNRRITGNVGYSKYLSDKVVVAFNYYNLNYWTGNLMEYPTRLSLGFSATASKNYYASIQLNYSNFKNVECSLGLEYWLARCLAIRAGVLVGEISNYSFGFGFLYKRIRFDIGFRQYTWLGLSSAVGINYIFGNHE